MNKVEFLDALHQRIDMLDDAEVSDILNEYSLHIDCKVKCGMTEQEAVADFGDVADLAADVLGAYHVKAPAETAAGAGTVAGAAVPQTAPVGSAEDGETGEGAEAACGKGLLFRAGKALSAAGAGCVKGIRSAWEAVVRACKGVWSRLFSRKRTQAAPDEACGATGCVADGVPTEGSCGEGGAAAGFPTGSVGGYAAAPGYAVSSRRSLGSVLASWWRTLWRGATRLLTAAWRACVWVVLWCAVATVAFVVLLCALGAAFLVFSFGLCLVLAAMGYPLWGITLALMGASAVAVALTVLLFNVLRWHMWPLRRAGAEGGSGCALEGDGADARSRVSRHPERNILHEEAVVSHA